MATFNRINQSVYSIVESFQVLDDGQIQVKYTLGTGSEVEEQLSDFQPLVSNYLYLDAVNSKELLDQPLTEVDIGKQPNQIMLDRIYERLLKLNIIRV